MKGVAPSAAERSRSASALKDIWHVEATSDRPTVPSSSSSKITSLLDALPDVAGEGPPRATPEPQATPPEGKDDADEDATPAPSTSSTPQKLRSPGSLRSEEGRENEALRLGKGHLDATELDRTTTQMVSDALEVTTSPFMLAVLPLVASFMSWLENLNEPERTGLLARIVFGSLFQNTCICVIGLNALFIWHTTDQEMYGMARPGALDVGRADLYHRMEIAFVVFYSCELMTKLSLHRWYFFVNSQWKWNAFDLFLVCFSIGEQLIKVLFEGSPTASLSFLRMMRMMKIVKVLRLLRTLRYFNDLRLMMDCVVGSVVALFWCLVMIAFVLYIFAILMMQLLMMYMKEAEADGGVPQEDREIIDVMFGSVGRACVTLLASTTGGYDWNDVYVVLVPGGFFLWASFLFYILFFVVAAWNIVTSTFVEKALKLAQPDVETLMLEQAGINTSHARELKELFAETDTNKSNSLSFDEFNHLMEHPKFRSYLEVRGININDVDVFYKMMLSISDSDEVDLNTFVNACLRLKGYATSIDLHALKFEMCVMRKKMADSIDKMMDLQVIHILTIATTTTTTTTTTTNEMIMIIIMIIILITVMITPMSV